MKVLRLKKDEDRRLLAGHLWIYSNEIDPKRTSLGEFSGGDLVVVENHSGRKLGLAYVNPHCLLCARLLSHDAYEKINADFFRKRFERALQAREKIADKPFYRLIFGESDFLPGLVIDRYGDLLVIQITTAGMEQQKAFIIEALSSLLNPKYILLKNTSSERKIEGLACYQEWVSEKMPDEEKAMVVENNTQFYFPLLEGQKTGWFYDHRLNRQRLCQYVKNQKVLDVFSYVGAFAIPAAVAGADSVHCIDSSELALNYLKENAALNKVEEKIKTIKQDAFDALKKLKEQSKRFDVIILDPPAFIKRKKDLKEGKLAYLQLNILALQLLDTSGILLSASCSMHLSSLDLLNILRQAGVKTRKNIKIIEQGHQGPDHPIHPAISESNYLKSFLAIV